MNNDRFMRDYELIIKTNTGEAIIVRPPIRIQFDAVKSVDAGLNSCRVRIYNLSKDKRKKLVKEDTDTTNKLEFLLKAGYNKIETLFKGFVLECFSEKSGADIVTTAVSMDGLVDAQGSYTSTTVKKGDAINVILKDMPNTTRARISDRPVVNRAKVLVGNSLKLVENNLKDDETYYIDEGKLYIIKQNEVVSDIIPLVNASTGLLNTPTKKKYEVTFNTLLNPSIRIGCQVKLESIYAENLNGTYKVLTITYRGDSSGTDWSQEVICVRLNETKLLLAENEKSNKENKQ